MHPLVTQLNVKRFMNVIKEFKSEEEADAKSRYINVDDVRYIYHGKTWRQDHFTYEPSPFQFEGCSDTNRLF